MAEEKHIAMPKDHMPPNTGKPKKVTINGVTVTIDPNIFDDLDILEDLYAIQNPEDEAGTFRIVPFLRKLCGDSYKDMKEALRDEKTGRVSMERVSAFIEELLEKVAPNS